MSPSEPPNKTRTSLRSQYVTVLNQLKDRKVCRTAMSYALVMWFTLQVSDVAFPLMGLPDWTLRIVAIVAVAGLPAVLVLAWLFELTPTGLTLDTRRIEPPPADEPRSQRDPLGNMMVLATSLLLTVLLVAEFTADEEMDVASASVAATCDSADRELSLALQRYLRAHVGVSLPISGQTPEASAEQQLSVVGTLSVGRDHRVHLSGYLVDSSTDEHTESRTAESRLAAAQPTNSGSQPNLIADAHNVQRNNQLAVAHVE